MVFQPKFAKLTKTRTRTRTKTIYIKLKLKLRTCMIAYATWYRGMGFRGREHRPISDFVTPISVRPAIGNWRLACERCALGLKVQNTTIKPLYLWRANAAPKTWSSSEARRRSIKSSLESTAVQSTRHKEATSKTTTIIVSSSFSSQVCLVWFRG